MYNGNARKFTHLSGEINSLYHGIAAKIGISDTALDILYILCERGSRCLQSDIFRLTGISRQTINSAIKKLEREGIIYLEQGKGRSTVIRPTEEGASFLKRSIQPVFEIENRIWDEWTVEEQRQYLALTQKYRDALKRHIDLLNADCLTRKSDEQGK